MVTISGNKITGEQIRINYPSGQTVNVFGKFWLHGPLKDSPNSPYGVTIVIMKSTIINEQEIFAGSVAFIDPRSLIIGNESGLLYNPRTYFEQFDSDMKKWMQDNPDWPNKELLK